MSNLRIFSPTQFPSSRVVAKNEKYLIAFGQNLKNLIEKKGLSPEALAAYARIETKQVYRIINGEHSTGISTIFSIAEGLEVHPKVLFDFEF